MKVKGYFVFKPLKMRIEILRYLADTVQFKSLNDFLRIHPDGGNNEIIARVLGEMYSTRDQQSVIELHGDAHLLGIEIHRIEGDILIQQGLLIDKRKEGPFVGTLENILLKARITVYGMRELAEYDLRESIRLVNESVVRTNRATKWIAIVAMVASILSLSHTVLLPAKSLQPELTEIGRQVQLMRQYLEQHPLSQKERDSVNKP